MNKRKTEGLTLIEVIIAIFVLSMGFLSVVQLYPLGIKTSRISYHQTIASSLGQEKIEEMLSKSYDEVTDVAREKLNNLYEWQADVSFVDPEANLAEIQTDKGIKKIKVTIYWNEGQAQKEFNINTLYTKK
jgi:type IV pilus assembly protein PilV